MSGSHLEKYDPNSNRPPKVDPKFGIERVGRQSTGSDSSGSQRQGEQTSQRRKAGLDDLYGESARQFEFEGEIYHLLRVGNFGTVTGNFLTATHIRPASVPVDRSITDSRYSWENMRDVYNGRTDRSNNFFLHMIAFLDQKPTEAAGLSLRRTMASLVTLLCQTRCATQTGLKEFLDYQTTMDIEAGSLKFGLDERFKFGDHFRGQYGTYSYPIVGTELRLYYGEGVRKDTLTQGRTPAANPVGRDIIVLSRQDLAI